MFNKTHSLETKNKMSLSSFGQRKSKTPLGLYDINDKLIKSFLNQVELGKYLGLYKGTNSFGVDILNQVNYYEINYYEINTIFIL
jgi:hypothetical protein